MFTDFTHCLEALQINLSTAQKMQVFKHLACGKSFVTFTDFCNLTEERRRKIDPGMMALTARVGSTFRTPSRQEYERIKHHRDEDLSKHEIKHYLQQLEPETLETMMSNTKSTKHLNGGPMIFDKKSPLGQPRRGFSIPDEVRQNSQMEYGVRSYKKGAHSQLKEVLANQFIKDDLIEKLNEKFISEMKRDCKPKRDWRTRAF